MKGERVILRREKKKIEKKKKGDDIKGRKMRNDFEKSFSSLQNVSKVVINTEFKIMLNFIPGLQPLHTCAQMDTHMH